MTPGSTGKPEEPNTDNASFKDVTWSHRGRAHMGVLLFLRYLPCTVGSCIP